MNFATTLGILALLIILVLFTSNSNEHFICENQLRQVCVYYTVNDINYYGNICNTQIPQVYLQDGTINVWIHKTDYHKFIVHEPNKCNIDNYIKINGVIHSGDCKYYINSNSDQIATSFDSFDNF